MEVVVMIGLGLLLVTAYYTAATAIPSSKCQRQCGNVEIPYPFGIDTNCSMPGGFGVTCQPRPKWLLQSIHRWP